MLPASRRESRGAAAAAADSAVASVCFFCSDAISAAVAAEGDLATVRHA